MSSFVQPKISLCVKHVNCLKRIFFYNGQMKHSYITFLHFTLSKSVFTKLIISFIFLFCNVSVNAVTITSTATGGSWNTGGSWVGGAVPVAANDVVIASGATVTLNSGISVTVNSLALNGGTITGTGTTPTLTVTTNLTNTNGSAIAALNLTVTGTATVTNGTLNISSATGTKTFGNLTVSGTFTNTANCPITIKGNLINNTSCSFGTGNVTFTGATNNTISGNSVAFLGGITVNKGTLGTIADTANVLDMQMSFTLGTTTATALTLQHGTFKVSGSNTFTVVPIVQTVNTTNNVIPLPSKLWLANSNCTLDKGVVSFDWGLAGVLQLDAGTINIGIAIDDRVAPDAGGTGIIRINGGAMNIAGRISFSSNNWTYVMTGGTLTVGKMGNSSPFDKDPFNMDSSLSYFSMTGGTIIIERAGGGGGVGGVDLGYHNVGTKGRGFIGGTLQIGDASTPATNYSGTAGSNIMRIETDRAIYNLVVASANAVAQFQSPTSGTATTVDTVYNNVDNQLGVVDIGTGSQGLFVDGDWTVESSVSTHFIPGTQTVTFNGTKAQNIGGTKSTTFYDLTIKNTTSPGTYTTATVTLAQPTYITRNLTLTNGYVNTTATNILWMLNNSGRTNTTGSTSSYVNGPMNVDMALSGSRALSFPIGQAGDWRPAVLTAVNNAATTFTYNAIVNNADASALGYTLPATVDTVSQVHYCTISRYSAYSTATGTGTASSANINGNQTMQLYFGTNDVVKDGSKLTVCKNTSASPTTWFDIGGTGGPAYSAGANLTGSITSTSSPTTFTTFSNFTLGSLKTGWNPLPIELLNFNATPCNNNVCLNWATASETNNDYFTIEKTKDAVNYDFVAKVAGAGNSSIRRDYSTLDIAPYEGISYYRLKQTDFNGHFTYSNLKEVNFGSSFNNFSLNVYPNPSTGENISLAINSDKGKEILVVVYDVTGKETYSKVVITEQKGTNVFALDPSGKLASGIYMITATSDDNILSKKLIVR